MDEGNYYQLDREVCRNIDNLLLQDEDPPHSDTMTTPSRHNDNYQYNLSTPNQQLTFTEQHPTFDEYANQVKTRLRLVLLEYLADSSTIETINADIKASIPPSALQEFIIDAYGFMMDKSITARLNTGQFFAALIVKGTISIDSYCTSLKDLFFGYRAIIMHNPTVLNYYAELIAPLVNCGVLQFWRLHICCFPLIIRGFAKLLLSSIFKIIILTNGIHFLMELWNSSNMRLEDFMQPEEVLTFIAENNLHFLVSQLLHFSNNFGEDSRFCQFYTLQRIQSAQSSLVVMQPFHFNAPTFMPPNFQMLPVPGNLNDYPSQNQLCYPIGMQVPVPPQDQLQPVQQNFMQPPE